MNAEAPFSLVGVLHLLALPGAPVAGPGLAAVRERALQDAEALVEGGIRTVILENFGDAPFRPIGVEPHVPALMAALVAAVKARFGDALTLGVNVLRNDALAALGAAVAAEASFIRVNVHVSATWTDQGLIQGTAYETLRYRRALEAVGVASPTGMRSGGVAIAADLLVKHGVPAGQTDIEELARETAWRGGADILIVTGPRTGAPADLERVRQVRGVVPDRPCWVGSGTTPDNIAAVRAVAQGAIVGTYLHERGQIGAPLDPERVRRMVGG